MSNIIECPICKGNGTIEVYTAEGRKNYQTETQTCDTCHGAGEVEAPEVTELEYVEIDEPLCSSIFDAYDPERDGPTARVTRTDFQLAEAITTLQSNVERQGVEIQQLRDAVAKLTTLPY